MKKVCVIGAGFAGIAAASCLAQQGFAVTLLEKNDAPGGRARKYEKDGFTFDMGPSWYWMPDVFESYFARFGKKPSDYFELKRLDPSYRIYYSQDDVWDVPASLDDLGNMFESIEPGSKVKLMKFLDEGKYKYEIGMQDLVHQPGLKIRELMQWKLVAGVLRLHVFQSVSTYVKKYFRDPRLIQLLEFPVLFLGASADKTPALYTLMNYADMVLGTWYPMGGMYKIVEGMIRQAEELSVQVRYNAAVEKIIVEENQATGVYVNGSFEAFDYVVGAADYHHVEQVLLDEPHRNYTSRYWDSRKLAPSCLIFYLGFNRRVEKMRHHTLFFDRPFALHAQEIYQDPKWPTDPLFYVSVPSITDATVAPPGHENMFILIPVAPDLKDDETTREFYFQQVMDRLEKLTGQSLRPHIVFKRSYAHSDFVNDYHSFKGNAYGLANTLLQTANLKPIIRNKRVSNLFYAGQLTVPGPGVPPSLISGQIVAREITRIDREKVL